MNPGRGAANGEERPAGGVGADGQVISSRQRRLRLRGGPVLETSPLAAHGERAAHPAGGRIQADDRMCRVDDQFTACQAGRRSRAVGRVFGAAGQDIGDQAEMGGVPEVGFVLAHLLRAELTADRDVRPAGPDAGCSVSWGSCAGLADVDPVLDVVADEDTPDRGAGVDDDAPARDAELAQPAASTSDAAIPRPVTSRLRMMPPAAVRYGSISYRRRTVLMGCRRTMSRLRTALTWRNEAGLRVSARVRGVTGPCQGRSPMVIA